MELHLQWEEKYQQQSTVNSQNTEDDLKILLRILSIFHTLTSLINTRDWAFYAWTLLHTCLVCTATENRVFLQSSYSIGRGWFNQHPPGGFSFLRVREYRVPSAAIWEHQRISVRAMFWVLVVWRRGFSFFYLGDGNWRRYDLEALARRGEEAEFQEEIRRERENR